ncbi:MAG TPA: hypothetical protein DCY27_05930 [Desulfobacterales bacterium]|nr:hypothetical protein [Desulfobacterales bacterium]
MRRTNVAQDLMWSLFFCSLALILGLIWHWPMIYQGLQGRLIYTLQQLEQQEAARRLEGVRTFNLEQAFVRHQQGQTLFLDARPYQEYQELHIEGALNLTPAQVESNQVPQFLRDVNRQQPVIVYCGNEDCHASLQVAEWLQSLGFSRVAVFLSGFRAWDQAGYPVDVSR